MVNKGQVKWIQVGAFFTEESLEILSSFSNWCKRETNGNFLYKWECSLLVKPLYKSSFCDVCTECPVSADYFRPQKYPA